MGVFPGDALFDRLRAFEACRSVEVNTLLTAPQFKAASEALARQIQAGRKEGSAGGAADYFPLAGHGRSPRAKRLRPLGRPLFPLSTVRVLVAPLPVFSISHESPLLPRQSSGQSLNSDCINHTP